MIDDGRFKSLYYRYWNRTNTSGNILCLTVNKDGSVSERQSTKQPDEFPIFNWTIDSDEAYSIAMKNEKINEYIERYDDEVVDSFYLSGTENGDPVWRITWMASSGFVPDNPHPAEIQINATTGEVLYVDADLSGSSSSIGNICMGFSIVFIAVVVVAIAGIVWLKRRKKN